MYILIVWEEKILPVIKRWSNRYINYFFTTDSVCVKYYWTL